MATVLACAQSNKDPNGNTQAQDKQSYPDHKLAHRIDLQRRNVVHLNRVRSAAVLHIARDLVKTIADLVLPNILDVFQERSDVLHVLNVFGRTVVRSDRERLAE